MIIKTLKNEIKEKKLPANEQQTNEPEDHLFCKSQKCIIQEKKKYQETAYSQCQDSLPHTNHKGKIKFRNEKFWWSPC